jgi:hypothetical protein
MTYTNGEMQEEDGIYCERIDGEVLCMKFSEYMKKGFVLSEALPIKEMTNPPKGH